MNYINQIKTRILKSFRKIYRISGAGRTGSNNPGDVLTGNGASQMIREKLLQPDPLMIARYGAVELACMANFRSIERHHGEMGRFIKGDIEAYWWDEQIATNMAKNAGFFPLSVSMLERFCRMMIDDSKLVDILASWQVKEKMFKHELSNARRIALEELEPYNNDNPWSEVLKGKQVLVIHPFQKSIETQFKRRDLLFSDKRILPDFELKTIKAVQSIAMSKTKYPDWFEALDSMKAQILSTTFDIAILGCGAYGFPLAAYIKRLGKKAIHLGGATQMLFGIKGKRWETKPEHARVAAMINSNWIRAGADENPKGSNLVEDGCYW